MNKLSAITLLSLILILSISFASASDVDSIDLNESLGVSEVDELEIDENTEELSTENVIYISPDGTGDGSSESNPTNWQNAIDKVSSNGVIQFSNGTYSNIKNTYISNVELRGSGNTIINASGDGGFFATYGQVILNKISFVNAYTGDKIGNPDGQKTGYDGEGAIVNHGQLTVKDCYFASNQGIGTEGGAIHNSGTCYIYDSTFFEVITVPGI